MSGGDLLATRLPDAIRTAEGFERWFEPLRWKVMVAVQQVHAAVQARLEEERKRLLEKEGATRPVWQVTGTDGSSLLKSASSARSKLGREISALETASKLPKGSLSLDQVEHLLLGFPDLGRFRIVCDFTCDVDCARKALLPGKPPSLLGRYRLAGALKDYVYDLDLRRPARGHRAFQFAVEVPSDGGRLLVEIQLMTLLQAAWDRRNHPLYEWSREGGVTPAPLVVQDVALAEALHLVDAQATLNWQEFVRLRKRKKGK